MADQEYLFSLAVHRASFGPHVEEIKQNAFRQNQKFKALIDAINEAESKNTIPPHLPDGKAADATVTRLGVYESPVAAMIVGRATIPGVVLPDDGRPLSDEMRIYLESVLKPIFKVEGKRFDTNIDLLPFTWVIIPLQELCEEGKLIVAGMGGATGG